MRYVLSFLCYITMSWVSMCARVNGYVFAFLSFYCNTFCVYRYTLGAINKWIRTLERQNHTKHTQNAHSTLPTRDSAVALHLIISTQNYMFEQKEWIYLVFTHIKHGIYTWRLVLIHSNHISSICVVSTPHAYMGCLYIVFV